MGGNINWVLILEDGTEYRMNRWTNPLKWNTTNRDFLAGKPEAIQESLKSWLGMKDDWERNKDTGNYEQNMTEVYAPYPAPITGSEYGIVVTDFRNKMLMSCNHYTSMNSTYFFMPRDGEEWYEEGHDYEAYIEAKWYYEQGLITKLSSYNEEQKKWGYFSYVEGISFDDFLAADKSDRMKTLTRNLPFGWTVLELNKDTLSGRQNAYNMLKNDFKLQLTDFEESALKQWVAQEWDDE